MPLYLRDGAINPELTPTQRAVAAARAQQSLVNDDTNDSLNLHKLGYRFTTDAKARNAGVAAKDAAYRDYDTDMNSRYLGDASGEHIGQREGDLCMIDGRAGRLRKTGTTFECIPDQRQDGVDSREAAYEQYDREMADAWRK